MVRLSGSDINMKEESGVNVTISNIFSYFMQTHKPTIVAKICSRRVKLITEFRFFKPLWFPTFIFDAKRYLFQLKLNTPLSPRRSPWSAPWGDEEMLLNI